MSSAFVSANTSVNFTQDYRPRIAEGRFTLVNNTLITVTKDGRHYESDLSLAADFSVTGANKRMQSLPGYSDYSGINRQFMSVEGVFDTGAALAEFARSGIEKRLIKEDTISILTRQTKADSHEAFLMNMLISWLKADTYRNCNGKEMEFKVRACGYESSHAKFNYTGIEKDSFIECELGPPVGSDSMRIDWALRTSQNYWDRPYVLHYNASGEGQEKFYLMHTLGRDRTDNLNFEININGIDTSLLALDPLNGDGKLPADIDNIPWDKADILWEWIMDYVHLNRLQQQFAAAFEVLGAIAYQPQWSSLEACVWQKAQIVVVLAEFSPTRARIRGSLEGEPFIPSAMSQEFSLREGKAPNTYLMSSALMNYYMWYGYYTLIHNEAASRVEWATAFTSVARDLHVLKTPLGRAAAVSAISGKEVDTCMSHGCGMYIDTSLMSKAKTIGPVTALDESVSELTQIDAIYAPVSGCLGLGTMTSEYETTLHLTGMSSLPNGGSRGAMMEPKEVLQVATVYRLFGYDCDVTNSHTGEYAKPWAPARDCIIEGASICGLEGSRKHFDVEYAERRRGRSNVIPQPLELLEGSAAIVQIQRPAIRMSDYGERVRPARPFIQIRRSKVETKFYIKSAFSYAPDVFRARGIKMDKKAGFGSGEVTTVPTAPVAPIASPESNVPMGATSSTAESAE